MCAVTGESRVLNDSSAEMGPDEVYNLIKKMAKISHWTLEDNGSYMTIFVNGEHIDSFMRRAQPDCPVFGYISSLRSVDNGQCVEFTGRDGDVVILGFYDMSRNSDLTKAMPKPCDEFCQHVNNMLKRNEKTDQSTKDEAKVNKNEILLTATQKMIGTFFVPITALELASEANSIREVSTQYVNYLIEFLRASLENDRDVPFPPASGLVYGPVTSFEELEQGKVKIEIFNGNHSLLACKSLVDEFPSAKCLQTRQVTIYRDLTEEEIQTLALIGNEESSNSKPTSDFDKIRIMRKKFLEKFNGNYTKEYLEYIYQIFNAVCQNKKEETKKKKSVGLLAKLGAMDGNCYNVFLQLQQNFPDHGSYIYESMFKLSKNSALYLLNEIKDERIKFQDIKSSTKKMPECEDNEMPFVPKIRAKKSAKTMPVEGKDTSKKSVQISSAKGKLPGKEISRGQSSTEEFASQQSTRKADNDIEVTELKKQNKELKDQLDKTTEEINTLKGEIIQLMTIRMRNQELEADLYKLKNDTKKEKGRIKEIESKNKELTHQLQENKEEMKIFKEECLELDMFKTRNKELESEIKKLKSDIAGLKEEGSKNKEAFEPALKRKRIHEKNTDTKDMTEGQYPFSFEETNKKYGIDNSTDDTTEMEIVAINWNEKVYLCQKIDTDKLKFCKKPFGFIDKRKNFIPTNNVGWNILNNKDIQSLNKNCIITKFKCEIKNNNLQVSNTDIKNLKSKIIPNYIGHN